MAKKRAFVRYSKNGKIVPGSLILTSGSFPSGPSTWNEIPADLCCETTTTTTTVAPTTTTTTTEGPTTTTTTAPPVSDERLKQNIVATGGKIGQFNEYTWEWNDIAKSLGLNHYQTTGVIAQEVLSVIPNAVEFDKTIGYYRVNYNMISND